MSRTRTNFARQALEARTRPEPTLAPEVISAPAPAPAPAPTSGVLENPNRSVETEGVYHGPIYTPEPISSPPVPPPAPEYAPPSPPSEPDPYLYQMREELETVRSQLAAERAARQSLEDQRKQEQEELQAYNQLKRDRELEKLLNVENAEFVSLDPDDARKLLKPVYERLSQEQEQRYKALESQIEAQKALLAQQTLGQQEALVKQKQTEFNDLLVREIPNISQLLRTPGYKQFTASPMSPGSSVTMEEHLNQELQRDNLSYVVSKLKSFAQGKPSPADIAQVGTATTGYHAAVNEPVVDDLKALRDRLNKRRNREITRQAFRQEKQRVTARAAS